MSFVGKRSPKCFCRSLINVGGLLSTHNYLSSNTLGANHLAKEIRRRYEISKREAEVLKNIADEPQQKSNQLLGRVDSIAATNLLMSNSSRFSNFALRIRESEIGIGADHRFETGNKEIARTQTTPITSNLDPTRTIDLPLSTEPNQKLFVSEQPCTSEVARTNNQQVASASDRESSMVDRGFFIRGSTFSDDYVVGTTADLPEDEMTESPLAYFGDMESAIENIEFQLPGQGSTSRKSRVVGPLPRVEEDPECGEWLSNYDTSEDTDVKKRDNLPTTSRTKCAACGAAFHNQNPSLPGFVPPKMFWEIERNEKRHPSQQRTDFNCRRCSLFKHYDFLLNVNICEVDYAGVLGHLKLMQEALILLVVDMADLQCSIHRDLPRIIGDRKPMIVIGNKIDLIPPDTRPGYLKHCRNALESAVKEAGFATGFNILKYHLVSAKTGFGVEDLITNIYLKWIGPRGDLRSDVYVVGCTNAGKSTLFNAFLQSDLCKVRALDLVERVNTSIWPGTTLSLLKFPLMNPTPYRLELRRRRLLTMQAWRIKEDSLRRVIFRQTNDPKYVTLQGFVDNTYKDIEEEEQPVDLQQAKLEFEGTVDPLMKDIKKGKDRERRGISGLNSSIFTKGKWCYDTPGTVNSQQVLDVFTLEELINVIPRKIIVPRVFIMHPGQTLLVGGIARIDLMETWAETIGGHDVPVYLTIFASDRLQLNVMGSRHVDTFLTQFVGNSILGAPIGDAQRLAIFPKLKSKTFEFSNSVKSFDEGAVDILLSSIGWVMFSSKAAGLRFRAWTPQARGLMLRHPPLLPFSINYRGTRIAGTNVYRTRPLNDGTMADVFTDGKRGPRKRAKSRDGSKIRNGGGGNLLTSFGSFDLA